MLPPPGVGPEELIVRHLVNIMAMSLVQIRTIIENTLLTKLNTFLQVFQPED